MFTMNPIVIGMGIIFGISFYILQNGQRSTNGLWMFIIPLVCMIINPIFNHRGNTILFFVNNNAITKEAVIFGFVSGLMIMGTILWFSTFSKIMTSDKLLYIFGSISPKLALILSMTLRYIPLYKAQIVKTNNAQKAMGLYKDNTLIDKVKGGLRVFSIMTTWALENGVITADSMTARGYGVGKRSRFAIFKWSKNDYVLMICSVVLSVITSICLITGDLSFNWYPVITGPGFGLKQIISYSCFIVLAIIPNFLTIKEEYRWKSLTSKI